MENCGYILEQLYLRLLEGRVLLEIKQTKGKRIYIYTWKVRDHKIKYSISEEELLFSDIIIDLLVKEWTYKLLELQD